MKKIGLRIDVDTLRGTRHGVPALCDMLSEHNVVATFYFSVGPDNMGRNLWRLLKPAFLKKMLRSNAPNLYGWDILLMGTAWPGPKIGKRCEAIIRSVADAGHEMGFHAWDHQKWQAATDRMSAEEIHDQLKLGMDELTRILGKAPITSAVPGWRCNNQILLEKDAYSFAFNSDCRGTNTFIPTIEGRNLVTPQIPVTLPTYDEAIGGVITDDNYNDHILSLVREDQLNILTIHAEVEGIACREMFSDFLRKARDQNIHLVSLGDTLKQFPPTGTGEIIARELPEREGWLAFAP